MNRRRLLIILVFVVSVVVVLTAADSVMAWYSRFQVDEIQARMDKYGFQGQLIFLGLASIRPLLMLPVTFFFITGGLVFGTLEGSLLAISGLIVSSSLCYCLARRFQGLFHRIVKETYIRKVKEAATANLVSKIFSLRASPGMPFDLISYASGLTNVSYRKFILGTFLGAVPRGVLYTYLGHNLDNYLSPETITVYSVLLALALAPHGYRLVQKKRHQRKKE